MNDEQTITNEERSYFAIIPHMADDDLNLYEYRLYGHYRRMCGEHNRRCVEKTITTAEKLGMSKASVINTRRSLETKGYIRIEYERQHNYERVFIHLEDIWPQNMSRYSKSYPQETPSPVTQETGTGHVGNRYGSRRKPPPVTSGTAIKEEHVKEEPVKEKPFQEEDDADLRSRPLSNSSSKNASTRDHACKILGSPADKSPAAKHDAIRALLTSWLPEITGYGGWDNWLDYLHALPDYQLYDLAEWFYRFIARPTWAAKIDNPSGFILTMMDTPGKRSPGTSPVPGLSLCFSICGPPWGKDLQAVSWMHPCFPPQRTQGVVYPFPCTASNASWYCFCFRCNFTRSLSVLRSRYSARASASDTR